MNTVTTANFNLSDASCITEPFYRSKLSEFPEDSISLIKSGSETVGWLHLDIPDNPLYSCFIFIYITPSYRRQGIGASVYRDAEIKMKASGCNWWSSYPQLSAADKFAMSVGFDYTNTNSLLQYNGGLIGMPSDGIREYTDSDFPAAPDLWSREYGEMHLRLGLPYEFRKQTDEERENCRNEYHNNHTQHFVLEVCGKIIGIGSLFTDNTGIGALAIDKSYVGNGYGTKLAAYITDECIRRRCAKPVLYCETGNFNALHIYQKLGYKKISRESVAVRT